MYKKFRVSKTINIALLLAVFLTVSTIYLIERYNYKQKQNWVQLISSSYVNQIKNSLVHSFSATYPIAALVRSQSGEVDGFTKLATEMLPLYPGLTSLQLQPNGVLTQIIPLEGNEAVIGHNIFSDPDRNKEAFLARDTGNLTLAGPFNLIQGGVGAVARLPIYLETNEGKQFWGFSAALMRFPDILNSVELSSLVDLGIAYQLIRIHPDTGEIQTIQSSQQSLNGKPITLTIEVPNGEWYLNVVPIGGWLNSAILVLEIIAGIVFLLLFSAFLVYRERMRVQQEEKLNYERNASLLNFRTALLTLSQQDNTDFQTAISNLLTVATSQLHVARASIWLYNDDKTAIECQTLFNQGAITTDESIKVTLNDCPMYFKSLTEHGFISADDALTHPQTLELKDNYLIQLGITSMLDTPIRIQGELIGITSFEHIGKKRTWGIEEEEFARSISDLCAQAILEAERIKSEEKLILSSRVFNNAREGIIITNTQNEIIDINPAFSDITGYSREDVIDQNPKILSSGRQSPEFYQAMWQEINEHGYWQGELWNRTKEGELYIELLSISVLKNEQDKVSNYVGIFSDITQSKCQQEKLNLMAHYDMLTELPNRTLFADRFHQSVAHSKRSGHQLAICFLDLDNFKPVNDNYGHEAGDQLLIEVAKRIKDNIREEDTASRQGGDEFALLLNDIESYSQCEITIKRLLNALAQPYVIDDSSHNITASLGVTLYPDDTEDIDTLIRHADNAMYQAKQSGKHRYHFFDSRHDKQLIQKHHKLDEIQQALINNEFRLYYQPKVNMVTGEVFGVEALIRWIHPEKGLIPPLDFLPLIDDTDLELQIGDWVINQALQQMNSWLTQDIKLQVSVNIASRHLQSDAFFANLEKVLAHYPAVDSTCFQLEILESSALSDLQAISQIIRTCQETLGMNVALDDFGTGYSSLTHLRNLTANTIKIDQSFVRDMLDDPDDYTIIDGIIGLAESFGREVIAEGVETTEHGLMLQLMNCKEAQGYGIAKPMPADEFPMWLSHYQPNQQWLECGKQDRSVKANKLKLFRLISEHWMTFFVSNMQSKPQDIKYWPIMGGKLDPCGQWIKRETKVQLFTSESLNRLDKAHQHFHTISQAIYDQYQQGDVDAARETLAELQAAFDEMSNAVELCE